MRGKVLSPTDINEHHGITPAYAGKRTIGPTGHCVQRDHPRICGEKAYKSVMAGSEWGSPPHMRGKALESGGTRSGPGDHPRICGEKGSLLQGDASPLGSPPHMRGKGP